MQDIFYDAMCRHGMRLENLLFFILDEADKYEIMIIDSLEDYWKMTRMTISWRFMVEFPRERHIQVNIVSKHVCSRQLCIHPAFRIWRMQFVWIQFGLIWRVVSMIRKRESSLGPTSVLSCGCPRSRAFSWLWHSEPFSFHWWYSSKKAPSSWTNRQRRYFRSYKTS